MNKSIFNSVRFVAAGLISLAALSSCKKDKMKDPVGDPLPTSTLGVYVLSEGAFGQPNKSAITYYDIATKALDKNYFQTKNGVDLGTSASDLKQYGSKMYCVITGLKDVANDSFLEVISIATGKSIKRIPFSNATGDISPRYIIFNKNKAYVSGYNGTISRIDTTGLTIEAQLNTGGALEEMAIVNNKLYVTNSDNFQYPSTNKASVSVVDLTSFTKLKEITVGYNPTRITANEAGELFVLTKGDYTEANKPSLDKINTITDTKVGTNAVSLEFLKIAGTQSFVIGDFSDPFLKTINLTTGALGNNFITDATVVAAPFGATVNPLDKNVVVTDHNNYATEGKAFIFNAQGVKQVEFSTGAFPQAAVFNYSYK